MTWGIASPAMADPGFLVLAAYLVGSIPFGYDQTQTRQPFWVGVPDAAGVYRPRRFANVYEYQVWYEQQIAGPG